MCPDRVSNSGPLTYESGALPTALRGPARKFEVNNYKEQFLMSLNNWWGMAYSVCQAPIQMAS